MTTFLHTVLVTVDFVLISTRQHVMHCSYTIGIVSVLRTLIILTYLCSWSGTPGGYAWRRTRGHVGFTPHMAT
jgi:hypothetical protein